MRNIKRFKEKVLKEEEEEEETSRQIHDFTGMFTKTNLEKVNLDSFFRKCLNDKI